MMNQFVNETTAKWRTMLVRVLLRLCILSAVLLGYAPKQAHAGLMHNSNITPGSAYLEYAATFPSTGWLFAQENGTDVSFSSGVLIDEHWVLTSAHGLLANDADTNSVYEAFEFGLGPDVLNNPGESLFADAVFIHPDYVNVQNGPDLALLYFAQGFQTGTPVDLYTGQIQLGDEISLAGYGRPATPATGFLPVDGKRRAGAGIIEPVPNTPNGYFATRHSLPGDPNFLQIGMGLTNSSSGGGAYYELFPDSHFLAGIASYATIGPTYGSVSGFTALYPNLGWIQQTTAVPEPSSIVLLFFGSGLVAGIRRRRVVGSDDLAVDVI